MSDIPSFIKLHIIKHVCQTLMCNYTHITHVLHTSIAKISKVCYNGVNNLIVLIWRVGQYTSLLPPQKETLDKMQANVCELLGLMRKSS